MGPSTIRKLSMDLLRTISRLALDNYDRDPAVSNAMEAINYMPDQAAKLRLALTEFEACMLDQEQAQVNQLNATDTLTDLQAQSRDFLRAQRLIFRIALKDDPNAQRLLGVDEALDKAFHEWTGQGTAFYGQLKQHPELQAPALAMGITEMLWHKGEQMLNEAQQQKATQQRGMTSARQATAQRKEKREALFAQLIIFHEAAQYALRNDKARYAELGDRLLASKKRSSTTTHDAASQDALQTDTTLVVENLSVENLSVEHLDVEEDGDGGGAAGETGVGGV